MLRGLCTGRATMHRSSPPRRRSAKLALADLSMDDLVSVQVFCPDLALYDTFNEVYATYFEERYPVRAFVGSGPLLRGCRFEINGIAVKR